MCERGQGDILYHEIASQMNKQGQRVAQKSCDHGSEKVMGQPLTSARKLLTCGRGSKRHHAGQRSKLIDVQHVALGPVLAGFEPTCTSTISLVRLGSRGCQTLKAQPFNISGVFLIRFIIGKSKTESKLI